MAPLTRTIVVAFVLAVAGSAAARCADASRAGEAPEPAIKAAYLLRFGSFVEWPSGTFASETSPFRIGVVEADEILAALRAAAAGQSIDGRAVEIVRLEPDDAASRSQVLFLGRGLGRDLARTVAANRAPGVLVVTESDPAIDSGGAINFVAEQNRIRFDVSLPAAREAGLRLSSRLLGVARRVVVETPE
jgi:hypothetical protein